MSEQLWRSLDAPSFAAFDAQISFKSLATLLLERRRQEYIVTEAERMRFLATSGIGDLVLPPGAMIGGNLTLSMAGLPDVTIRPLAIKEVPDQINTVVFSTVPEDGDPVGTEWSHRIGLEIEYYSDEFYSVAQTIGIEVDSSGDMRAFREEAFLLPEEISIPCERVERPALPHELRRFTYLMRDVAAPLAPLK